MSAAARRLVRFLRAEDGPTNVEYAAMLALILVVCVAIIASIGETPPGMFDAASAPLEGQH